MRFKDFFYCTKIITEKNEMIENVEYKKKQCVKISSGYEFLRNFTHLLFDEKFQTKKKYGHYRQQ